MSALICVFNRDAEPVEPGVPSSMLEVLQHRGPDGANQVLLGSAALGIQRFDSLPEDGSCVQPLLDQGEGIAFVFDGRLDNREQLSALLDLPRSAARADAELAAGAYARWGEDAFARLIGSFVLVAVHQRDRRVVLARDALGDRTLYYLLDHRRLLVASEPCALLRHPSVSRKENPAHVAAYFNLEWPADGHTVMQGIDELLPAHYLVVDERRSRTIRYWRMQRTDEYRRWEPGDIHERYLELFTRAVARRSRSNGKLAVSLSGGLDSTSVAAIAARHGKLAAFSFFFEAFPNCDERPNINAVLDMLGLEHHWLCGDEFYPLAQPAFETVSINSPESNPFGLLKLNLYRLASKHHYRTMLTGDGGDLFYLARAYFLLDLLLAGEYQRFGSEFLREWKAMMRGDKAARQAIVRILPLSELKRLVKRPLKPWLTRHARNSLPPYRLSPLVPPGRLGLDRYDRAIGMFASRSECLDTRLSAMAGVERRNPYRDRQLVEFMVNLPQFHLHQRGCEKKLVRHAMQGLLPDTVLQSGRAGLLYDLFAAGVTRRRDQVSSILFRPDTAWQQFVDPAPVEKYLASGRDTDSIAMATWRCITYELWRDRFYN